MERIRILLAEIPQTLCGVIKEIISAEPDMEIVGEVTDGIRLLLAAGEAQADVVVTGLRDSELPGICSHLLNEYPHLKVLALTTDGRTGSLYEFQLHEVPLGEISQQELLAAIRSAVHN